MSWRARAGGALNVLPFGSRLAPTVSTVGLLRGYVARNRTDNAGWARCPSSISDSELLAGNVPIVPVTGWKRASIRYYSG